MDWFLIRVFESEIEMQCRFVLLGAQQIDQLDDDARVWHAQLDEIRARRDVAADDNERIKLMVELAAATRSRPAGETIPAYWSALQTIVVASTNISKLLWGGKSNEAERKPLRDGLGVDETSSISRDRDLRNDFEHFDERIAEWYSDPALRGRGSYLGRNIGVEVVHPGGEPPRHFGYYDPDTAVVTFWENTVDVRAVVAEAGRILRIVEERHAGLGGSGDGTR